MSASAVDPRAESGADPRWRWLAFYAAIAGAWLALAALHLDFTRTRLAAGDALGAEFWRAMCASQPSFGAALAMWSLMSLGMMAPAAVPMLRTYDQLAGAAARRARPARPARQLGFWSLLAGFLAVWFAFALAGASAQLVLQRSALLAPDGSSTSRALTGSLLLLAGVYQLTPLKHACLRACRAPLARFLGDWDARALYAFRKGFREGAWCLGCCWALMLLAFAAGVMNLAFMGLATLVMIAEKTALLGRRGSLALGLALCAAGALTLT